MLYLSLGWEPKKLKKLKMNVAQKLSFKLQMVIGLFESGVKDKKPGFFWTYYAPYFISMKEQKQVETFCHLVYASADDKEVNKWIEEHNNAPFLSDSEIDLSSDSESDEGSLASDSESDDSIGEFE